MAKIYFDLKAEKLIQHSKFNDYAAQRALLLAADYLDVAEVGGVTLPYNVAAWLGRAIKKAMSAPRTDWARALTNELGLTTDKPRPPVDWYELGQFVEEKIKTNKLSPNKSYEFASAKFGISVNTSSVRLNQAVFQ